jgi:hypothetical protein
MTVDMQYFAELRKKFDGAMESWQRRCDEPEGLRGNP